jgi:hypothetical protein
MIAIVALAFTSCKKNNNESKAVAFHGSVERFVEVNQDGEFERMYIDQELNTFFEEGDMFGVYCITEFGSSSGMYQLNEGYLQPVYGLTNVASDFEGEGAYYAFYPGENALSFTPGTTTNLGVYRLDATQTYRGPRESNGVQVAQMPEKAVYMAAKDEEAHAFNQCFFPFRNIMGALSLRLYSPEGQIVKSIAVKDNKFNLVGDVTLRVNEVDPVYMTTLFRNYNENDPAYMAELAEYLGPDHLNYSLGGDVRNTVVMDCGAEGVELGTTPAEATRFLIVLRPLALLEGGEITITFDDNTTKTFTSTKDNRISPNVIRNINPMNVD